MDILLRSTVFRAFQEMLVGESQVSNNFHLRRWIPHLDECVHSIRGLLRDQDPRTLVIMAVSMLCRAAGIPHLHAVFEMQL
jgi:hypothetical protein